MLFIRLSDAHPHRSYRGPVQMKIRIAGSCPVNLLLKGDKKIISEFCLSLKDGHARHVLDTPLPEKIQVASLSKCYPHPNTIRQSLLMRYIMQSLKPQGFCMCMQNVTIIYPCHSIKIEEICERILIKIKMYSEMMV